MTDNIVKACVEMLYEQPEVCALLGSDDVYPAWIFEEKTYFTSRPLEGSQQCAIVVREDDAWTDSNEHNTMEFPLLDVFIYADPARDYMGNFDFDDTLQKIQDVREAMDKHMNWTYGRTRMWGNVRVLSSRRLNRQRISPVSEGDGMRTGYVSYALQLG